MGSGKWFRRGGRRAKSGSQQPSKARRRSWLANAADRCSLSFETLEDRRVMATFMVTNLDDLDADENVILGSLRWAVDQSNANGDEGDTIVFADSAFTPDAAGAAQTIFLNGGVLTIAGPLRLLGPGARKLEVAQTINDQRVFMVDDMDDDVAVSVEISGMGISGGSIVGPDETDKGGGVYTKESLLMNEVVVHFNSASQGGDGIFVERGSLRLHRSFIDLNPDFTSGQGILMGGEDEEMRPFVQVVNTTIAHHGVGIFNRNGTLNIEHCTITDNGIGVQSQGNPVPEEEGADPPPPTVFTNIYSSIVFRNTDADIERVGMTEDEEDPMELLPSITSLGFNIYATGNVADPTSEDGMMFANPDDKPGVDPLLIPFHEYVGGSTEIYLLDPMSPAIDMGDPTLQPPFSPPSEFGSFPYSGFEQRGRHFTRFYDYTLTGSPRMDIGAVEMQSATFVVDTLVDEFDDVHSKVFTLEFMAGFPQFTIRNYEASGDFSLREAIEFAELNPGPDVIQFTQDFISQELLEAEDLNGGAPTIRLVDGPVVLRSEIIFEGPDNFVLEIDASGNDPSPGADNSTGTRVFLIDDLDTANFANVSISSLTLMGADVGTSGGAIFSRENLTVRNVTIKDNHSALDGGAIYAAAGALTVQGSTFSNNLARRDGGAIFINSGVTARISNATFSNNRASIRGGAIANNNGTLLVEYATITLNTASTNVGHGIVNMGAAPSTQVRSTVVANNGNNISDVAFTGAATASTFTSLGHNFVGKGNALSRFNQTGDITNNINPMLGPLLNTGGIVDTHQPLPGSPLIDAGPTSVPQLITPTAVTSSTSGSDDSPASNLIDGSGLSSVPTYENFATVTHADADAMNAWETDNPSTPSGDYFEVDPTGMTTPNPKPELTFTLSEQFALTDMVVWGFPEGGPSSNEARWFLLEFSVDGGTTFYQSVRVEHELTAEEHEVLDLGGVFWADTVRVTVFDNHFDGFSPGGDSVGLGELKFLTNRFDERGPGFDRIFDGNSDGTKRIDIGAYERQGISLIVSNPADENDGVYTYGNLSLREAIELANANPLPDTISFDPAMLVLLDFLNPADPTMFLGDGVLTPGTPSDIRITDNLTISGPGLGMLAIDGSLLDHASTTINGSGMFTINDGLANNQIDVDISGVEFRNAFSPTAGGAFNSRENLTLDNVRFVGNRTELMSNTPGALPGSNLHGGAIYQEGGTLTISNSEFTSNRTIGLDSDGGGIYVLNGLLDVSNTFFNGNLATLNQSDGGAVAVKSSTFLSNGNFISGNQVGPNGAGDGGGIHSDASIVTLNETFLTANSTAGANSNGGGLAAFNSTVDLNNSGVNDNQTNGSQSDGGGVYVFGGTLSINQSQFFGNRTLGQQSSGAGLAMHGGTVTVNNSTLGNNDVSGNNSHGGGIYNLGGVLVVRSTTLTENDATHSSGRGGAIYSDTNLGGGQSTLILNSTISGNSASARGGGVYNADGRTDIKHSTITKNSTSLINMGSGVASFGNSATTLTTVQSSIIAANVGVASGTRSDIDSVDGGFQNSIQSLGYNVIGTGNSLNSFGSPLQSTDQEGVLHPGLAPLANNGGLTDTHALLETSVAVNAGSPSFNPNAFAPPLTLDQNGTARVKQGRIDVGAFESEFSPGLPADFDGDNDVDGSDFLSWQRNVGANNATKSQGDADGNGVVNGQDLAEWRDGFGPGGAQTVAASSASFASSTSALEAALSDEPVGEQGGNLSALGSLGLPGAALASGTATELVEEAPTFRTDSNRFAAASAWDAAGGMSMLEEDAELDSFAFDEEAEDPAAEDAVFAALGEELL